MLIHYIEEQQDSSLKPADREFGEHSARVDGLDALNTPSKALIINEPDKVLIKRHMHELKPLYANIFLSHVKPLFAIQKYALRAMVLMPCFIGSKIQ